MHVCVCVCVCVCLHVCACVCVPQARGNKVNSLRFISIRMPHLLVQRNRKCLCKYSKKKQKKIYIRILRKYACMYTPVKKKCVCIKKVDIRKMCICKHMYTIVYLHTCAHIYNRTNTASLVDAEKSCVFVV